MQIEWMHRMVNNQPTPIKGELKHELTLHAVGNAAEIEWLSKQLDKIGDKEKKEEGRMG